MIKKFIYGAVIVLIILIFTTCYVGYRYTRGRFVNNVFIAGVNVSYKTLNEARELVNVKVDSFYKGKLSVFVDDEIVEFSPVDLGLIVDIDETFEKIKKSRFDKFSFDNILRYFNDERDEYSLVTNIDEEVLIESLDKSFILKNSKFQNSSFDFDENGVLVITESKNGMWFDKENVSKSFEHNVQNLDLSRVDLNLVPHNAEIIENDLINKKDEIAEKLRFEFTMEDPIYSEDWKIKLIDHLDWVDFEEVRNVEMISVGEVDESVDVKIVIKVDELNKFIDDEISEWLDRPAADVKIYYEDNVTEDMTTTEEGRDVVVKNEATSQNDDIEDEIGEVEDDDRKIIIKGLGTDGLSIDRRALKSAIELAVNEGVDNFEVPVIKIAPNLDIDAEIKAMGIEDVLAVGHTSYYGSTRSRIHNIKRSVEQFNGVIIQPDEIFSFVKQLGPVNAYTGYKPELVIKKEGTIPEYGGGICQVSTTFYRTALFSGLPIIERHPHSYAVSYYSQIAGHGLDATIYIGGPDLKFKNDTGYPILMQGFVKDDYELYVVFYGKQDGRKVEMDGPYIGNYRGAPATIVTETTALAPGVRKITEHAHNGFTATWYRILTNKDGDKTKEEIYSKYRAMPAKVLVGATVVEEL